MNHASHTEPVIIICAARSGSKLLRSVLNSSGDFSTCNYDANYIWKYGNYRISHDELTPSQATPSETSKIRAFFTKICLRQGNKRLLEKTVSNSLRIDFVRRIYPNAKIIHLYRNGFSAVNSTLTCWGEDATSERIQSSKERNRKLRDFPIAMAWPYLLQYIRSYLKKIILRKTHVDSWGPRYKGIDEDVQSLPLSEVCAKQWAKCINNSISSLSNLTKDQEYINVRYEDLIVDPAREIHRIANFVGMQGEEQAVNYASGVIDPGLAGQGRYTEDALTQRAIDIIQEAESSLTWLVNPQSRDKPDD